MKDWKGSISTEVKNVIDLDLIADMYFKEIKKYLNRGLHESLAIKSARIDMINRLLSKDIKRYDIIHVLHCCRVKVYPTKHEKCGCH